MVEKIQNRVIFNGNIDDYKPKTEIIKGESFLFIQLVISVHSKMRQAA